MYNNAEIKKAQSDPFEPGANIKAIGGQQMR